MSKGKYSKYFISEMNRIGLFLIHFFPKTYSPLQELILNKLTRGKKQQPLKALTLTNKW